MQRKNGYIMMATFGVLLAVGVSIWLSSAQPVRAQCGSQASSCKNCHETQAQDPVNNDGTAWHTQHAFGDFCYLCHAGNNQATDKTAAHTGMVAPLSDIVTNCMSCHPNDYAAQAQIYATTLGVTLGNGSASNTAVPVATSAPASNEPAVNAPMTTGLALDDPNLVNYAQRYDEIVLGKHPINWGNVILIAMILMLAVGGGGFAIYNEKLVKVLFVDTQEPKGEYPSDVVDMLPAFARLKPKARKLLKSVLDNPEKTKELLGLINAVFSDKKTKE